MKSIREGEADPRGPGLVFTHRDPRKRKTVAGLLKSLLRLSLQQPSLIPVALTPLVDCYQPDTDHAARAPSLRRSRSINSSTSSGSS